MLDNATLSILLWTPIKWQYCKENVLNKNIYYNDNIEQSNDELGKFLTNRIYPQTPAANQILRGAGQRNTRK